MNLVVLCYHRCFCYAVSLGYKRARPEIKLFAENKANRMSFDLELEEFSGLGTTPAPRVSNAESRN